MTIELTVDIPPSIVFWEGLVTDDEPTPDDVCEAIEQILEAHGYTGIQTKVL